MDASWLLLFIHTGSVMGRLIGLRNANLRGFLVTRDVALHACRTRKVATRGDNFMKKRPASRHQVQVTINAIGRCASGKRLIRIVRQIVWVRVSFFCNPSRDSAW
jgi:hypothetical protein